MKRFCILFTGLLFFSRCCFAQAGSLDTTFNFSSFGNGGGAGVSIVRVQAVQPDGKVLIGGDFSAYNNITANNIARLNTDGSLDTSFHTGSGFDDMVLQLLVQADGKILVGGPFYGYNQVAVSHLVRLNADGSLDTTFNRGGFSYNFYDMALQPDGKIIIVGAEYFNGDDVSYILRIHPDGSRDSSFLTGWGFNLPPTSVRVHSNGKIMLAGSFYSYNGTSVEKVIRLNSNGTLDNTFDLEGTLTNAPGEMELLQNGKMLITGFGTATVGGVNGTKRYGIARYNYDGKLDTTFNSAMYASTAVNDLTLQPDGKALVGGDFSAIGNDLRNNLARLNTDGSIDTTFKIGEGIHSPNGSPEIVYSIAVQADGKILAAGAFQMYNHTYHPGIVRIQPGGLIDSEYNPHTGFNNAVRCIALQPDGKILMAGEFTALNEKMHGRIVRLHPDGRVDTTFKTGEGFTYGTVRALAVQPDGKIVVGGNLAIYNTDFVNHLLRLLPDGSIDTAFTHLDIDNPVTALALQPNGKIIVGGYFQEYDFYPGSVGLIMRMNSDGSRDNTFNTGPGFSPVYIGGNNGVETLLLQPDGKIVVGGMFTSFSGRTREGIARLQSNGSVDFQFNPPAWNLGATYARSLGLRPDGKIIVGGSFGIFSINANGTLDTTFYDHIHTDLSLFSTVYAIQTYPSGETLLAGTFTSYDRIARKNILRINADFTLDQTFNPSDNFTGTVYALAMQPDDKIVVGGDFDSYDGDVRYSAFRLFGDVDSLTTDIDALTHCSNDTFSISFSDTTIFNPGNQFIVQLSDSNGSFNTHYNIDTLESATPGNVTIAIPLSIPGATGYRIRVNSTSPPVTGHDNGADLSIRRLLTYVVQEGSKLIAAPSETSVTYQWLDCNDNFSPIANATVQEFIPTASGNYAVEVSNGFCTAISGCKNFVMTGAAQVFQNTLSVYPNPFGNDFVVNVPDGVQSLTYLIRDLLGRTVKTGVVAPQSNTISLSGMQSGMYLLSTEYGATRLVKK